MKKVLGANTKSPTGKILRTYFWRISLLGVLSIFQSVLQVGMALLFRYVIDAALAGGKQLPLWSGLLIADLVLQVVVYAVTSWHMESTVDKLTASLRGELLKNAVNCADNRLEAFHSGQLLSRGMEDVRTYCDGIVRALPALVGQVARLVMVVISIVLIHPSLAMVLLLAGLLVLGAVAMLRPVLRKKHRAVRKADEKVMSVMQEDMQQLELIQSLDIQTQIEKRFARRQKRSLEARFHQRLWSVGSSSLVNALALLGTGLLLLWGGAQVAEKIMSYGTLMALIQLLNQFRMPVLSLSGLWTRYASVEVSEERLSVLLETPRAERKKTEGLAPTAVVFENVTFCYEGEEIPVLQNFSLRLPLEGWTCLGGFSGRGKSTLFKLILGLYAPQEGRVYLETAQGDIPCNADIRHLFAYVPQDYALFSGTVQENLLLVAPEADEETRRKALAVAQADFVWEMSGEEQTYLRENNTGLSKGQIQRLAIARAILMDRPIFLLDECTSALDAQTEQAVLAGLQALGKTVVLVTHRPEALEGIPNLNRVSMEK